MPKFYAIFPDEQHMRKALNNLFSWMRFTFFIRNLDKWILKVLSDLQVSFCNVRLIQQTACEIKRGKEFARYLNQP